MSAGYSDAILLLFRTSCSKGSVNRYMKDEEREEMFLSKVATQALFVEEEEAFLFLFVLAAFFWVEEEQVGWTGCISLFRMLLVLK